MTYKINTSDGNLLTEIPDGTCDTNSSSLTLIGKNFTNFGESINENFVKLLENFSGVTQPERAIRGQIWYNAATGRLNVFDGNAFRITGGPLISATIPSGLVSGDLWINNETNQLWFYDGTDLILAGPSYTSQQGISGLQIDTIIDIYSRGHTVAQLYVGGALLGIFSKDTFTPVTTVPGFSPNTELVAGFNASNLPGIKFDVTATRANSILLDDGVTSKTASEMVFVNEENVLTQKLSVQTNDGIVLGGSEQAAISLVSNNLRIEHQLAGKDIALRVKTGSITADGVLVSGATQRVGIFTSTPQATLDVNGDVKISGDLLVEGTSVTVNASVMVVKDKNIELGATDSPSEMTADGGGITLKSDIDKLFAYSSPSSSWKSSENLNLNSGKVYKIADNTVLTATALGDGVVTSKLTALGDLTTLRMQNGLNIVNNAIQTTTGNLVLSPTGNVDLSAKRVVNVASPVDAQDAATKYYVDHALFARDMSMTLDITGLTSNVQIAEILDKIAPFYNASGTATGTFNGTTVRLHTTSSAVVVNQVPAASLNISRVLVDRAGGSQNQLVVSDVIPLVSTPPQASIVVTRQTKLFTMTNGQWLFTSDLEDAYTT